MKITFRVPTEMYAFAEVTIDAGDVTAQEVKEKYDYFSEAFKPKPINSLPDKEYNEFIDRIMLGESNHIETWEKCSPEQKAAAQVIKRSLKRLEARENRKQ